MMKLKKKIVLTATLVLGAGIPAWGQVDKVAMRTTGISCGTCAAVSEIYLRRLDNVDKVTISTANEVVMVAYKPGATFHPSDIRDVLKKTEVGVLQFQISARGRVQEQGGKRVFVAGKDRFLLVASPTSPQVPAGSSISVEGIINDKPTLMELKILTFKVLKQ